VSGDAKCCCKLRLPDYERCAVCVDNPRGVHRGLHRDCVLLEPPDLGEPLFDITPTIAAGAPALTAGEKRRVRIAAALAVGTHPLGLVFAGLKVHPDPERRCGNCRFRVLVGGHAKPYPKCMRDRTETPIPVGQRRKYGPTLRISTPYATRGEATDVRSSWPGCQYHEPKPT
jgi:hypothetical protein